MKHGFLVVFAFAISLTIVACGEPDTVTGPEPQAAGLADKDKEFVERTAEAHADDVPVASEAVAATPKIEAIGEFVAYGETGDANLRGYLAMPADVTGPLPGVIVIHEWWGLNDNIKKMTERLAGEGYMALAVDLFDGQVAENPKQAQALMAGILAEAEQADNNIQQAYTYLEQAVGAPRIGVIGWCLGGGWSLRTALLLPDQLDATVIYYGAVSASEEELETIQSPILGFFGSEDAAIPVASAKVFRTTLNRLGKKADVRIYDGAGHAFANPSGNNYQPFAAEDAWQRTLAFFSEELSSE